MKGTKKSEHAVQMGLATKRKYAKKKGGWRAEYARLGRKGAKARWGKRGG